MRSLKWIVLAALVVLILAPTFVRADASDEDYDEVDSVGTVENGLKGAKIPSKTDDEVIAREEQAMSSEGYSVAEQKQIREQAQKFTFQAEVNKLMHILINSLYSNKEIFLRELISNASDALDKIRFLSLTNPSLLGEGDQAILDIRIKIDVENKLITITDRGVGMTKDDLVKNLGTIAQSGTKDFLNKFAESGDGKATNNLIGQFGVGFYSSFLVADTVSVTSKHNDDDQYIWTSKADGSFSVAKDPHGNTLGRGTKITLYLKDDAAEYLENQTIKTVAKKYSEFISFPLYIWTSKTVEKEVPEEPVEDKPEEDVAVSDEEEGEKAAPKTVVDTVWDWELVNDAKPIWTRSPKDVTEEEYQNFFKAITKKPGEALKWIHFSAEGEAEFKSILYIPKEAPQNMFDPNASSKGSVKLFVRRVFITDDFEGLIPNYLRFIRGMVDSDDLPLNVSREILQQNKLLKMIEKRIVRKSIAMFQEMAADKDSDVYKDFWTAYGTNIKLGVIEDSGNRSRLSKLLMYYSSKDGELTSLDDYVGRMKEGQDQIFYLAGQSKDVLEKSPLLESVIKKGYEVLYMVDPIDEYTMQSLTKFDGKYTMTNLAKDGVKLNKDDDSAEDTKEQKKALEEEFKPLTDYLKDTFKDKIEKVVVSDRLTKTPCTLVASQYGYSANMERILKSQALGQGRQAPYSPKKIMEINPTHPLIVDLLAKAEDDTDSDQLKVGASVLYETASITSGYSIDDPAKFADVIHKLMAMNLGVKGVEETSAPTTTTTAKDEL